MDLKSIYQKIRNNQRINSEEALFLLRKAPWLEVAQLAAEKRGELVDPSTASYTMFRIVNYTDVCNIGCKFCSFHYEPGDKRGSYMSKEEVFKKIDLGIEQGVDQLFFQGGVNPAIPLDYYRDIIRSVKQKYGIHIRAFSPVEILRMAQANNLEIKELIKMLKEDGLDSVPGAGAEILVERVRKRLSPKKATVEEWSEVMKECHRQGLNGSANIVFGSVEENHEIIEHLEVIRSIQDETGGFNSFVPWTFQPQTTRFPVEKVPHHQYLKVMAICRLYLDNIKNIEVSVMVLGKDIGKLALQMGANDISSPVIEENVLQSFGISTEEEARTLIKEAGLTPRRRNFDYKYYE